MNRYTVAIGGLAIVVVALGLGLALAISDDDDSMDHGHGGYAGMMGAMGTRDSDEMLARMRELLSADDYALMLQHIQAHRDGAGMRPNGNVDQLMHQMMDGMMTEMPMDSGGMMGNR